MMTSIQKRRWLFRGTLALLWAALGVGIFIGYRGHTLLVDNKDQPNAPAPRLVAVTVDKGKSSEYALGDRDIVSVGGIKHRVTLEFFDSTPPVSAEFSLPLMQDMFILSVPKVIAGIEPFVEPFDAF
jgi:hypothetical protein